MAQSDREAKQALNWPNPDNLWRYACDIYDDPAMAAACLDAQDRHGADVNLILLALWMDDNQVCPTHDEWQALMETSALWHEKILIPQRNRRRALKGQRGYDAAKQEELVLEKQEQAAFLDCLQSRPISNDRSSDGGETILARYLTPLGVDISRLRPTG